MLWEYWRIHTLSKKFAAYIYFQMGLLHVHTVSHLFWNFFFIVCCIWLLHSFVVRVAWVALMVHLAPITLWVPGQVVAEPAWLWDSQKRKGTVVPVVAHRNFKSSLRANKWILMTVVQPRSIIPQKPAVRGHHCIALIFQRKNIKTKKQLIVPTQRWRCSGQKVSLARRNPDDRAPVVRSSWPPLQSLRPKEPEQKVSLGRIYQNIIHVTNFDVVIFSLHMSVLWGS